MAATGTRSDSKISSTLYIVQRVEFEYVPTYERDGFWAYVFLSLLL